MALTDQPPTLCNITVSNTTDGVQIDWNPLTIKDCAMNVITATYNVTVTGEGNSEGDIVMTGDTSAVITNLIPYQEYNVSVKAKTIDNHYACNSSINSYLIVTDIIFLPGPSTDSSHISERSGKGI